MLYDAYGSPQITQVGGAPPSDTPLLFAARRLDPANSGNPYTYCNNNPINCSDPSGLSVIVDFVVRPSSVMDVSGDSLVAPSDALRATRPERPFDHIGNDNFHAPKGEHLSSPGTPPCGRRPPFARRGEPMPPCRRRPDHYNLSSTADYCLPPPLPHATILNRPFFLNP